MMTNKPTLYFAQGGPQQTEATLRAARVRALELGPEAVLVTSSSGRTALEAAHVFKGTAVRLIAVPFQPHLWDRHRPLDPEVAAECRSMGVQFLPDQPVVPMLDDLRPDVVNAWRIVSQGFKVALQVAAMCVETGLLKAGAHVISLGGSGRGADTAVAVRAFGHEDLFRMRVTEIIAMPSAPRR